MGSKEMNAPARFTPTRHLLRSRSHRGTVQKHVYARGSTTGKVIAVDPATYTVDVATAYGTILRKVEVLCSAGTRAGGFYLQQISNFLDETGPEGSMDIATNDQRRTIYARVEFVQDNPDAPYVTGFQMPISSQMHFAEAGLALWRHESDAYLAVSNGDEATYDSASDTRLSDLELVASDGTVLRIGSGVTPHDRTATDVGHQWAVRGQRNANAPIGTPGPDHPYLDILVKHPSGTALHIDPAGTVTWTLAPGAVMQVVQEGHTTRTL
jgi:3D (Asp-Asp-Asp) domain-containing protein